MRSKVQLICTCFLLFAGCTAKDTGGVVVGVFYTTTSIANLYMDEATIDFTQPQSIACDGRQVISIDGDDKIKFAGDVIPAAELGARVANLDTCVLLRASENSSHGNLVFIKEILDGTGVSVKLEIVAGD